MPIHRWVFNAFEGLQSRYRKQLDQFEQELESRTISLPPIAPWTKRLTQIMLLGITAGMGWSVLARIDVMIDASGKLEPLSQSQVVQSRVGGVVTAVLVREGEEVEQGELLIQLEKSTLQNQLQAVLIQREQLVKETAALRLARQGESLAILAERNIQIPTELLNRIQNRLLLVAKLTDNPSGLNAEQRQRYTLFQQQLRDRQTIRELASSGLQKQISSIETQLAQTDFQLNVEQELLTKLRPLLDEGAISRTAYLRRVVDVNALQSQFNQTHLQKQQLQISHLQARAETASLRTDVQQELQRQLAELDAEFDATIRENQQKLVQIAAQINQVQSDLKNQDLRAPVDGLVFNLGPKLPGIVTQAGQTLLQVVPDEALIVRAQVANKDIANIQVGMPVDIRIDAYPFTEYGSVKGVVSKVGNEALAVNGAATEQTFFPVEVRLEQQLLKRGNQQFSLTPGMNVVAMIRVRQRAPISYVSEEIIKAFDAMQTVR